MAGKDHVQKVDLENDGNLAVLQRAIQLAIAPLHPFGVGDLTEDGVQYSAEVTTADGDFTEIELAKVNFGITVDIKEVEFGLTLAIKSTGATKFAKFKWQGRNEGGTWVDLHAEITYAANASVYKEYTMSGRCAVCGDYGEIPFEIRCVVQREDATEQVTAKIKNSSYLQVII